MADEFSISIDVKGLQDLLKKLDAVTAENVLLKSLSQGGQLVARWSKVNRLSGPRPQFLGVRTNRLRSSIAATEGEKVANGYQVRIGTNVEYARIHEFGGPIGKYKRGMMPARPFLRPAIEEKSNQENILSILTENLNEAIKNA